MHSKISSDNPTQSTINTISSTLLQVDQAWTKAGLPKDENYPLSGILYDLKSIPGAELSEAINLLFDQMEKLSSFYQKIAKDPKNISPPALFGHPQDARTLFQVKRGDQGKIDSRRNSSSLNSISQAGEFSLK